MNTKIISIGRPDLNLTTGAIFPNKSEILKGRSNNYYSVDGYLHCGKTEIPRDTVIRFLDMFNRQLNMNKNGVSFTIESSGTDLRNGKAIISAIEDLAELEMISTTSPVPVFDDADRWNDDRDIYESKQQFMTKEGNQRALKVIKDLLNLVAPKQESSQPVITTRKNGSELVGQQKYYMVKDGFLYCGETRVPKSTALGLLRSFRIGLLSNVGSAKLTLNATDRRVEEGKAIIDAVEDLAQLETISTTSPVPVFDDADRWNDDRTSHTVEQQNPTKAGKKRALTAVNALLKLLEG